MAVPTVNVSVHIEDAAGNAVLGVKVNAKLNRTEIDAGIGYVIPEFTTVITDASGNATLVIWPNALGSTESSYEITMVDPNTRGITAFTATIPNNNVNLWDVADLPVYPGKSDGEIAVAIANTAVGYATEWANKAEDSLISVEAGGDNVNDYSALHQASKAAASAISTAADVVSTGNDVVSTGNDVVSTGNDVVSTGNDVVSTGNDVTSTAADVVTVAGIYDQFDDRYLGSKASAPTLDNDGNALLDGAMYWNNTTSIMGVYDLGNTTWVALNLTAAEILVLLKTVDGAGSGLDADLLDGAEGALYARLASPALTGAPTAPTQTASDSTTKIATTKYVDDAIVIGVTQIPVGSLMLFQQTSAPTGWTKITTHNNKALRVVSGTAGSGGSVAFTTAFASQAVSGSNSATALSIAQMPSHNHGSAGAHTHVIQAWKSGIYTFGGLYTNGGGNLGSETNDDKATDSGGAHTHTSNGSGATHNHTFTGTAINMAVQYVDLIIASKD